MDIDERVGRLEGVVGDLLEILANEPGRRHEVHAVLVGLRAQLASTISASSGDTHVIRGAPDEHLFEEHAEVAGELEAEFVEEQQHPRR